MTVFLNILLLLERQLNCNLTFASCNLTFAALWIVPESLKIVISILSPMLDSFAQHQLCTLSLLRYPGQACLALYINIGYLQDKFSQPVLEVYSFFLKMKEKLFPRVCLSFFSISKGSKRDSLTAKLSVLPLLWHCFSLLPSLDALLPLCSVTPHTHHVSYSLWKL